ncbi:MAG: multidrug transporter MdfA, partial [Candidatus Electrothrix sp. AR5]|nr:multidrug transporter MdfA [Candidatus Electrothrix sp. AR5]
ILRPLTRTLLMPIIGSAWLTMHFGWLWLILPAAAMALLSWFGMQRMQVVRKEELS